MTNCANTWIVQLRKECLRCSKLEEEVEELKKLIGLQGLPSNQECEDSTELEATVIQSDEVDEDLSQLASSECIDRCENAVAAQTPSSKKSPRLDGDDSAILKSDSTADTPETASTDGIRLPDAVEFAPPPPPCQPQLTPQAVPGARELNRQPLHESSFSSFIGYEDSSLGELFKYAVVLAGPSSAKPKRLPLAKRTQFADFRRTRSLPEGHQEASKPVIPDESAPLSPPPSSSKFKLLTKPNRLTRQYSQTVLDFISEEPSPPPQRKPGWLSYLVSQRFRGATNPPGTAVEAPARLTTAPEEEPPQPSPPATPASKMVCVYPSQTKEVAELEGLVELCFPYGERLPLASDFTIANLKRTLQERHRTYRNADSTFVLTIASASNPCEITYAICVICPMFADDEPSAQQIHDEQDATSNLRGGGGESRAQSTQCCLCLLSPYPFFSLFFKVLFGVAVLWEGKRRECGERYALALKEKQPLPKPLVLNDFVDHFQTILSRLKHMRIPPMGGWSRMVLSPEITQLSFHRPHSESVEMERRMLLLEYAAPTLFALLSVDQVLFLLGCLCCEQKVLVVSDHVNIVSSCVLALITLLAPLQWAGPVITVLPPRLDELLEAPVPLIAGRVSIASASILNFSTLAKPMKGVIEMNMDQDNLCMHDEDLMNYHELKLPGCDALVHELEYFSSQLFGKHHDPDFPTVQQGEACEIICTRIHRYVELICALALGESAGSELPDDADTSKGIMSPRKKSTGVEGTSASHFASLDPSRKFSDLTFDYIRRFKETQMFSMFRLQRQEQQANEAAAEDDEDEPHGDLDEDDDENDTRADDVKAGECDPDNEITYEPDALCSYHASSTSVLQGY